jgi:hypothetical protein
MSGSGACAVCIFFVAAGAELRSKVAPIGPGCGSGVAAGNAAALAQLPASNASDSTGAASTQP